MKDGGPAFPVRGYGKGMTLRDYFAAAALTGLLASDADNNISLSDDGAEYLARESYRHADAMLAKREQQP